MFAVRSSRVRSARRSWGAESCKRPGADRLTAHQGGRVRDSYHEQLDSIGEGLVEMSRLAGSAVSRATTALLDADLALAEQVIAGDEVVNELYRTIEAQAFDLLARQQPVAGDLRVLVTSLRMVVDLE